VTATTHPNTGIHEHRELFATKLGLYPFNSCAGPANSRIYFYQVGHRVVLVQQFPDAGGWCEYIGSDTNSVDKTLAELKKLMKGV